MKTIGLIGGISWVSTVEYYRIINQLTNERLGRLNSAKILLYSVNFEEFKPPADPAKWGEIAGKLIGIAQLLEKGGAECILLCSNTPHIVADNIQKMIGIPLFHIGEMTAREIKKQKIETVGLLGTKITMEQPFFTEKLANHGIRSLIPNAEEREFVHAAIFEELTKGVFKKETKARFIEIIGGLKEQGAKGVILGCTEIPLLVKQDDSDIPLFDTTLIHASSAVDFALG